MSCATDIVRTPRTQRESRLSVLPWTDMLLLALSLAVFFDAAVDTVGPTKLTY